jgi:hypothetical protein
VGRRGVVVDVNRLSIIFDCRMIRDVGFGFDAATRGHLRILLC